MTDAQFTDAVREIEEIAQKTKFKLCTIVLVGRSVEIFKDVQYEALNELAPGVICINQDWLEDNPEWLYHTEFSRYSSMSGFTQDVRDGADRHYFYGRTVDEALDILKYCLNICSVEVEDKKIRLNELSSYLNDIIKFSDKKRGNN